MTTTVDPAQSTLLIIDLQDKLLPVINESQALLDNASKLMQCANLLSVPCVITEQLPDRLGATAQQIAAHHSGETLQKSAFSAAGEPELLQALAPRSQVVLLGTEAHVCVLQTALGLLDQDFVVWVVIDACGSRTAENKQAGLARLQSAGAMLVTTEMVIFEWLGDAAHPMFRDVLALIK